MEILILVLDGLNDLADSWRSFLLYL